MVFEYNENTKNLTIQSDAEINIRIECVNSFSAYSITPNRLYDALKEYHTNDSTLSDTLSFKEASKLEKQMDNPVKENKELKEQLEDTRQLRDKLLEKEIEIDDLMSEMLNQNSEIDRITKENHTLKDIICIQLAKKEKQNDYCCSGEK